MLAPSPWFLCREIEWAQLLRSLATDAYNCIMVKIRQDPPHTRMWRDDLKVTANGSGLRLVSYYVLGANHRPPPLDSRCRSAPADSLSITIVLAQEKRGLCHVLVLDIQIPIQGQGGRGLIAAYVI